MDRVCEELEEAKTEIGKLREEIKTITVLCETLKRTNNEQLTKFQEANFKVEKQAREINEREHEIDATRQMHEEIKIDLEEKKSLIKQLRSTNENLRTTSDERVTKMEVEKKGIAEKLEEVNLKNMEKDQELNTYKEETKCLKSLLSVLETKCMEIEKNAKASKELGKREVAFFKLEEERRKVEDQLKWKKEQFKHLKEAHEKLHGEFKTSEKEWDVEKSNLLDEMYKLQEKLDSQIRISGDFQSRLEMCHQALAHEEGRRKILEVQFSETKKDFDSVISQCDEAKMEIELLTSQRDEEIARLRDLVGKKEIGYKEMEHRVKRLEQENEELQILVKEFQESQINEKGASSSISKLQNKLKGLEKTHKDCLKTMREKEAEWALKLQCLDEDLFNRNIELEQKNVVIKELKINCKELDHIQKDCIRNLREKEADWASKLENIDEELLRCKTELELKNVVIQELELNCKELDQMHRDCSKILQAKEVDLVSQWEKLFEDLTDCKSELEGKDKVIKDLEIKCEGLDRVHQDCSFKLKSEEAQLTKKLDTMVEDLASCRIELEGKDEVIRRFEMKYEALDQLHRDCSSKLKCDEDQFTTQLGNMASDLHKYKAELEGKDEVIKELQIKCDLLDQISTKLKSKEEELKLLSKNLSEDLIECRTESSDKDEVINGLRLKMEILDELYKDCSTTLKSKETEWNIQSEILERDLSNFRYEVVCKNEVVKQLKAEIEELNQINGDFSTKIKAKEAEMVGKDEVMKEIQMALENSISSNIRLELQNEENSLMLIVFKAVISDMNMKISEREQEVSLLIKQLETKRENISTLSRKIESLSYVKNELETDLMKVRNELKQANEDLAENNELEFELHVWRSNAERLSENLEDFKNMRKDLEASLLRQIDVEESLKHDKDNLHCIIEKKDNVIDCLELELKASQKESGNKKEKAFQKSVDEIQILEQEWLSRELEGVIVAYINAERASEEEREDYCKIMKEKERSIERKQEELNKLLKAWEKIATDELGKDVEIQEKTFVIAELEGDLENLQMRFDLQQKDLFGEIKELKSSLENLETTFGKLEREKKKLLGDVNKLLSERERILDFVGSLSERISSLSVEDMKLASFWEKIVRNYANEENELYDPLKENMGIDSPLSKKSVEATVEGRSPLRALSTIR